MSGDIWGFPHPPWAKSGMQVGGGVLGGGRRHGEHSFQLEQRGTDLILVGQPPPERWAPLFQQQFWSVSCVALGFDYFRNI